MQFIQFTTLLKMENNPMNHSWERIKSKIVQGTDFIKVVANKDFGPPRKWILTYQICNVIVLDHLFQF